MNETICLANKYSLPEKMSKAGEILANCVICPRLCGINRLEGATGFCGSGSKAVVSSASPHFGEETPLVGTGGSGTIFFTSCNLKCIFCQNYEISHLMEGKPLDAQQLGRLMMALQRLGCGNINLVTPTHFVPQILEAVYFAVGEGLTVPLVYNTSAYDSVETLELLDGVIDIYMPDLKFMDSEISGRLMQAYDYPVVAKSAIREMHRQVGDLQIDAEGKAYRGLLVRHLVMPDDLSNTRDAMRFLAKEISPNTYVNIMNQYRPCGRAHLVPEINRSITRAEYTRALDIAEEEGIRRLDGRTRIRAGYF